MTYTVFQYNIAFFSSPWETLYLAIYVYKGDTLQGEYLQKMYLLIVFQNFVVRVKIYLNIQYTLKIL